MSKREYDKCYRCGTTIDITNQDRDLCNGCAGYLNIRVPLLFDLKSSKTIVWWSVIHAG